MDKTNTNVFSMYPKSAALGLRFVGEGEHDHEGFDGADVEKVLGARFPGFDKGVTNVFCCGHRNYGAESDRAGAEIHCYYARDVEAFLCQD